jgi:hypothetical protein
MINYSARNLVSLINKPYLPHLPHLPHLLCPVAEKSWVMFTELYY